MGPLQVLAGGYRGGIWEGCSVCPVLWLTRGYQSSSPFPALKKKEEKKSLSASGPMIKIYFGFCLLYAVFPPCTEN